MSAREQAITALAADIAKQMTRRHETLPEATYNRFLQSNLQIAQVRAREAVTSIELAGLMIVPAQFPAGEPEQIPAVPGDAFYEADFTLGSMLRQDLRRSIEAETERQGQKRVQNVVNALLTPDLMPIAPDSDFYAGQGD